MDEQTISTSEESMAPTPAKAKAKRKAKAMPKAKKRSNARRVAEGDGNERGRIAKCARQREERAHSPSMSEQTSNCLLYTSPSPRDGLLSRMPSSA